jgi:hypothetical protein
LAYPTKDKNNRLLESAKKAAQTDLASLPKVVRLAPTMVFISSSAKPPLMARLPY